MHYHTRYAGSPIVAESYDLIPAYAKRLDKVYYAQVAATCTGRILELGCGTGRILIPIAESGYAITGLDISEHMLAKCWQKLESLPRQLKENVQLINADMTGFELDDSFSLALIPGHAFQHLITVEDQMSCLQAVNRHLQMKARLVFDVVNVDFETINNPRCYEENEDLPECILEDGRRLRRTGRIASFNPVEQYRSVELIHYVTDLNGRTERIVDAFPFRYFFRYELEHILARCGFKTIDLIGDFDGSPFTDRSPEMIFVAEKRGEVN